MTTPRYETSRIVELASLADFGRPGIYFLHHQGEVVYVGQAVDMRRRVGQHIGEGLKVFDGVSCRPCPTKHLDGLERSYIREFLPRYNVCSLSNALRNSGIERDRRSVRLKFFKPLLHEERVAEKMGVDVTQLGRALKERGIRPRLTRRKVWSVAAE